MASFLKQFIHVWFAPENRDMIGVIKAAIDLIENNPNMGHPIIGKDYWLYEDHKKRFWIGYYFPPEGRVKFSRLSLY